MPRNILAGLVCLATVIVSAPRATEARTNPWGAGYFPDLPVVTQDGQTLHFYDDLIKGKIVVVSFIYTSCSDLCPILTARLAAVRDKLGDAVGRDIFFVSMSVDPEHDTPQVLKAYAEAFEAGAPGWQFVTGLPRDIDAINAKFGNRSTASDLGSHRNEILIGNDTTGDWERDSAMTDITELVATIHMMDPQWHGQAGTPQDRVTGGPGYYPMGDHPGQILFTKICAPCHTIGGGDHVGPDLRGVADRRDGAWLSDFIRNPGAVLARKDPDALALAARFPGVRMPYIGLLDTDAADLISYLRDQTSRLSNGASSGATSK